MSGNLDRRLTALESLYSGNGHANGHDDEPEQPKYEMCEYFRCGALRFDGPCKVRMAALWDQTGDIAKAVNLCNWMLRREPAIWILLEPDEIERAIHCQEEGISYYEVMSYMEALSLTNAIETAVQAWEDQGETIPPGGELELLKSWRQLRP